MFLRCRCSPRVISTTMIGYRPAQCWWRYLVIAAGHGFVMVWIVIIIIILVLIARALIALV